MRTSEFSVHVKHLLYGTRSVTFNFRAHRTTSAKTRLIDVAFYQQHAFDHRVPRGVHHEIEIVDPIPWMHVPTHVHSHIVPGSTRQFVCWTGALRNLKQMRMMVRTWCVGTVYTLVTGNDFLPVISLYPRSFLTRMHCDHKIFDIVPRVI